MKVDLSKVEKLYSSNIKEFGIGAKAVGWGTHEKQYLRFEKLAGLILDKDSAFSINELGCGYGELVNFFKLNKFLIKNYYGYDISQNMLDSAEKYLKDIKNTEISLQKSSSMNTSADYTIASGIFNVKFDEEKENWQSYVEKTIQHMFSQSIKGISFNFLTKYVEWEQEGLYYADPLLIFDYCKKNLSKKVNLIHDYDLFEFTIHIIK